MQILAGFRLLDDDFMTMVFQENIEAARLLLNILLKRADIEVVEVITQKEEKNPIVGGRSIVLDIFARDSEGKNYDVEVQRFFKETEGGQKQMCKAIEDMRAKEREKTRIDTLFDSLKNMMDSLNLNLDQAMAALKVSDEDKTVLMKRF